jgi:hypothetical protein
MKNIPRMKNIHSIAKSVSSEKVPDINELQRIETKIVLTRFFRPYYLFYRSCQELRFAYQNE